MSLDEKSDYDQLISLTASLPNGYTEGSDTLKVFATVGNANFRVLELPPLDNPSEGRAAKTRSRGGLDWFLSQAAEDQPKTRRSVVASASEEWTILPVMVDIIDRQRVPAGTREHSGSSGIQTEWGWKALHPRVPRPRPSAARRLVQCLQKRPECGTRTVTGVNGVRVAAGWAVAVAAAGAAWTVR